jgi:hypothetical protein
MLFNNACGIMKYWVVATRIFGGLVCGFANARDAAE